MFLLISCLFHALFTYQSFRHNTHTHTNQTPDTGPRLQAHLLSFIAKLHQEMQSLHKHI